MQAAKVEPVHVLLPLDAVAELEQTGLKVRPVQPFDHFPVTRLTVRFLRPATRGSALRKILLAEVTAAADVGGAQRPSSAVAEPTTPR